MQTLPLSGLLVLIMCTCIEKPYARALMEQCWYVLITNHLPHADACSFYSAIKPCSNQCLQVLTCILDRGFGKTSAKLFFDFLVSNQRTCSREYYDT